MRSINEQKTNKPQEVKYVRIHNHYICFTKLIEHYHILSRFRKFVEKFGCEECGFCWIEWCNGKINLIAKDDELHTNDMRRNWYSTLKDIWSDKS